MIRVRSDHKACPGPQTYSGFWGKDLHDHALICLIDSVPTLSMQDQDQAQDFVLGNAVSGDYEIAEPLESEGLYAEEGVEGSIDS